MKTASIALSALLVIGWDFEAQAIGRWMGDNLTNNNPPAQNAALPAGIRNSVVRVETGYIVPGTQRGTSVFASGVVIGMRREPADSPTGMLCVLSADHDTAFPAGVDENGILNLRAILFTDRAQVERGIRVGARRMPMYLRGPQNGDFRVDIALMGVPITDWANQVPAQLTPAEIAEPINDADLVLAGFGRTAQIVTANREMSILNDDNHRPGTYRSGVNRMDAVEEHTTAPTARLNGQLYRYNSIRSDMDFMGNAGQETRADAHMLNADSGGPTFQQIRDVWRLVGSHSESEQTRDNRVTEGARQWDVRLWDQRQWIAENCRKMLAIPEPSTAALGVFSAAVLLRWTRNRR